MWENTTPNSMTTKYFYLSIKYALHYIIIDKLINKLGIKMAICRNQEHETHMYLCNKDSNKIFLWNTGLFCPDYIEMVENAQVI